MVTNIKIGPVNYSVAEVDKLYAEDGTKLGGQIYFSEANIQIWSKMSDDTKRVVVLHEVIHGVLNNASLTEHEENFVTAAAIGLAGVLIDNPEFTKMFLGDK